MSKFKLTQTATEVQDILNNSLQKPTGLTKTKLVGVGVNGQENIEIGDNLTLANGKLSAAAGGVNGLESDAEGNLTASKNLGVDGKLTLKSLVSATNPDGDITKELGGGGGSTLYEYDLYLMDKDKLGIDREGLFYSSVDIGQENKFRTSQQIKEQLLPGGSGYELSLDVFGAAKITQGENTTYYSLVKMVFGTSHITLYYLDSAQGLVAHSHDFRYDTTNTWNVIRNIASPRKK